MSDNCNLQLQFLRTPGSQSKRQKVDLDVDVNEGNLQVSSLQKRNERDHGQQSAKFYATMQACATSARFSGTKLVGQTEATKQKADNSKQLCFQRSAQDAHSAAMGETLLLCTEESNDPLFWRPVPSVSPLPPPPPQQQRTEQQRAALAFRADHAGFSSYVCDIYLHRRSIELKYHPINCLAKQPQVKADNFTSRSSELILVCPVSGSVCPSWVTRTEIFNSDVVRLGQVLSCRCTLRAADSLLESRVDCGLSGFSSARAPISRELSIFVLLFVQVTPEMRAMLVDWLTKVLQQFQFAMRTLFVAVNIIDRFLGFTPITSDCFQLLGVTALLIAGKVVSRAFLRIRAQ